MIIEFKILNKISNYTSLDMNNWYYDDLVNANVLIEYDKLSQNMKDYIFDKGNIRECVIRTGSYLNDNTKKYIVTPDTVARFEINDNNNLFLNNGDILYSNSDFEMIKTFLHDMGIYSLHGMESLDNYMFIEITV